MVSGHFNKYQAWSIVNAVFEEGTAEFFIEEFAEKTRMLNTEEAEKIAAELLQKVKGGEAQNH